MEKIKKIGSFVFALLISSVFVNVHGLGETTNPQDVPLSNLTVSPTASQQKFSDFSPEVVKKVKLIVNEEINKFYEEKNKKEISEEVEVLNQKLEKERKKCTHYKHKLHSKEGYVSPKAVQDKIDKVKLDFILEFNRYLSDYINKSENKGKKLKQLDVGKIFSNFISLNFIFNNPNEVNINPSLIKGEAKASVAGVGLAV